MVRIQLDLTAGFGAAGLLEDSKVNGSPALDKPILSVRVFNSVVAIIVCFFDHEYPIDESAVYCFFLANYLSGGAFCNGK